MKSSMTNFFRFGVIAKGCVYLIIGILFIYSSQSPGSKDAIQFIAQQPFGKILLVLMGIGLLGYAAWRWYSAVQEDGDMQNDKSGMAKKIGYAASGTLHGGLAVYTFIYLMGSSGGSGNSKQTLLAKLLSEDWGQIVVALIGLVVIGVGIYHFYKVSKEHYKQNSNVARLSSEERKVFDTTAKAGLTARGVVFAILGYFLVKAGFQNNPSQDVGTGQVFQFLQNSDFPLAAILLAIGLALYGVYMFIKARYNIMQT